MDSTIAEKLQQAEAKIAQSELQYQRISANIAAAYDEAAAKGATIPATENSANLADTVASISTGSTPTLITKQFTENGTYAAEDDNADGYSDVEVNVPDASKTLLESLIDRSVVEIASTNTILGENAFSSCSALTTANFPLATTIGGGAFISCSSLATVNFPLVTTIGSSAFQRTALTTVNFPLVTTIGANSFANTTVNNMIIYLPSLLSVPSNAFSQGRLISIELDSASSITSRGFYRAGMLTNVYMPNVEEIGYAAFEYCSSLKINSLPPKTKTIGDWAFYGCSSIESLDMSAVLEIPTIEPNSFANTNFPFVFADQTQLDAYAFATNWSTYADRFQIKGATS